MLLLSEKYDQRWVRIFLFVYLLEKEHIAGNWNTTNGLTVCTIAQLVRK